MLSIRPEHIKMFHDRNATAGVGKNSLAGKVLESTFLGENSEHVLKVYGTWLRVVSLRRRHGG